MTENRDVLIVDDEKPLLNQMEEQALSANISAICVSTSEEAIAEIERFAFRIVIVDLRIRNQTEAGIEILRKARERGSEVRLYLLSAYTDFLTEAQMQELENLNVVVVSKGNLTPELLQMMIRGEVTAESPLELSQQEDLGIIALERGQLKAKVGTLMALNDAFVDDLLQGLRGLENKTGKTLFVNGRWISVEDLLEMLRDRTDDAIEVIYAYRDLKKLQGRW